MKLSISSLLCCFGIFFCINANADVILFKSGSRSVETGYWYYTVNQSETPQACTLDSARTCYYTWVDVSNNSDQILDCAGRLSYDNAGTFSPTSIPGTLTIGKRTSYPIIQTPEVSRYLGSSVSCTARQASGGGGGSASPVSNANISIEGNVSYSLNGERTLLHLTVDRVSNNRSGGTSGTLYLKVFATPVSGGNQGYDLGMYRLGELEAGYYFYDIDADISVSLPPTGSYYISILLAEYPNLSSYLSRVNFNGTVAFIGDNGLGVDIDGQYSWEYQSNFTAVKLAVEKLINNSNIRSTGTLRVDLWAKASPWINEDEGGFTGYRMATYQLTGSSNGTLQPGDYFQNIQAVVPIRTLPPAGSYYAAIVVQEYDSECGTSDKYCMEGIYTFSSPLVVPEGVTLSNSNNKKGGGGGGFAIFEIGIMAGCFLCIMTLRKRKLG